MDTENLNMCSYIPAGGLGSPAALFAVFIWNGQWSKCVVRISCSASIVLFIGVAVT